MDKFDNENDMALLLLDTPIGLITGYLGIACVSEDSVLRCSDSNGISTRVVEIPGYPRNVFRPLELAVVTQLNFKIDGVNVPAIVAKDVRFGNQKAAILPASVKMTDLQVGSYVALEYHSVKAEKDGKRWKVKCPVARVPFPDAETNIALITKQIKSPESIDDFVVSVAGTDAKECGPLAEEIKENEYQYTQKRCLKNEVKDGFEPVTSSFLKYTLDTTEGNSGSPVLANFLAQKISGTFVIAVHKGAENEEERINRAVRITPAKMDLICAWLASHWNP